MAYLKQPCSRKLILNMTKQARAFFFLLLFSRSLRFPLQWFQRYLSYITARRVFTYALLCYGCPIGYSRHLVFWLSSHYFFSGVISHFIAVTTASSDRSWPRGCFSWPWGFCTLSSLTHPAPYDRTGTSLASGAPYASGLASPGPVALWAPTSCALTQ